MDKLWISPYISVKKNETKQNLKIYITLPCLPWTELGKEGGDLVHSALKIFTLTSTWHLPLITMCVRISGLSGYTNYFFLSLSVPWLSDKNASTNYSSDSSLNSSLTWEVREAVSQVGKACHPTVIKSCNSSSWYSSYLHFGQETTCCLGWL